MNVSVITTVPIKEKCCLALQNRKNLQIIIFEKIVVDSYLANYHLIG